MAWPSESLDVEVGLLLDGTWVNATDAGVLARDLIHLRHGRSNWAKRTDPARARFSLDNRDGRWSPDYAGGIHYGAYRRNMACRIGVGRGDPHLAYTGVSADVASTPDLSTGGGGGGTPAYPDVEDITESDTAGGFTTSHVFDLPATVDVADRLLLAATFGNSTITATTDLDDWTLVDATDHSGTKVRVYEIEVEDSTMATALAGSTVEFTSSGSIKSSCQVIRVSGALAGGEGTAWDHSTAATGFGTAPNPGAPTASWGSDLNLFIALEGAGGTGATVTANPTSYTAGADGNASAGYTIGSAYRQVEAASDDPSAFTIDDGGPGENWIALTVVYAPAVGSGAGSPSYPAVEDITEDSETAYTTSHEFDLPATVATADRLLLVAAIGHSSAAATTDLDDWTLVYAASLHSYHRWLVYEIEVEDSTMATALAGSTVEFTTTAAVESSCQVIRVSGARSGGEGTAWDHSAAASGFGTAPNGSALAPTWGSDLNLFVSLFTSGGTGANVTANPTSYTAGADGDAAAGQVVGSAYRQLEASSDDPSAFTIDDAENWEAITFAYRPEEDTGSDTALDIAGDIDLRVELQLHEDLVDITEGGDRVRLAHKSSGADGWEWEIYAALGAVVSNFSWRDSSGTAKNQTTEATGADLPLALQHDRMALRVTLDVDNGAAGHDVEFYTADSIGGSWTQLGSTVSGSGTTSIKTNDAPVRVAGNPGDSAHVPLPGKVYAFEMLDGIGGSKVAEVDFTAQTLGATSFVGDDGLTWTVGAGGRITDMRWRFHGELASLPVRWNVHGSDVWSPVEATGLLRRLRQGNRRLESAIRRGIIRSASDLIQYWPCEEAGYGYTTAFGAAVGAAPFVCSVDVPDTAENTQFVCSAPLPTFSGSTWTANVDTYTATGAWQVRWLQSVPADTTGDNYHYLQVWTTDLVWEVAYRDDNGGELRVVAYRGETEEYASGWYVFGATGTDWRMSLSVVQTGSTVRVTLLGQEQGASAGGFVVDDAVSGLAGRVTVIRLNKDLDVDHWSIGHITLQSAETSSDELADELAAHEGEPAGERIMRLCREEGIRHRIEGDPSTTEAMGPQRPKTLVQLLEECAATDLGVLHEARTTVAVAYRCRVSMLDQDTAIALDYGAGEVAGVPELDRDDQGFANDVEVKNWTGTTARAVLDDGSALSVSEPPVGAGRYDSTATVNGDDSRLVALAESRLALSAVDEPRVSKLAIDLHHPTLVGDSGLTDDVLESSLGDLVTVDDVLTVAVGSTQLTQIVQGTTERIGPYRHSMALLTSPGSPWTAAEITPPPEDHSVAFRSQQALAAAGPEHVLTALGHTDSAAITRADLDDVLDDWVASTGGTTHEVTSSASWATAMASAVPGDLVRVTSGFDAALDARGSRYGLSGATMTSDGLPGLPIVVTCADGEIVDDNNTSSNDAVLDLANCQHVWAVGFNVADGQFGIRCQNWGGSEGFPAYVAYCSISNTGHSGLTASGWFQAIASSGGTPPAGSGNEWGYSDWFVLEENTIDGVGVIADQYGEAIYLGHGGSPGWISYAKDAWIRGNHATDWTADGIDVKPGCHRIHLTDNEIYVGHAVSGAPLSILYVAVSIDDRPSAFDFDPEIWIEGNRVWDNDVTNTNGSSAHIMGYIGLSGIRIANNVFWAHPQSGAHATWRARNEKGTNDAEALAEYRADPTWVVNNTCWGNDTFENAGYGNPYVGPFPGSITFDLRNNICNNSTPASGEVDADAADFVATVPAIGAAGDAEWDSYGYGSAFDLDPDSELVAAGDDISDVPLLIEADISQRDIDTAAPNPGAYQPHPANA